MAPASKQSIAGQYENYSIYIMLSSRGAQPGFHWGIFIPTATPNGHVSHATNREGGWKFEQKVSGNVPFSMSLILAYKIGSVNSATWQKCLDTLSAVVADGRPSPNTGEEFSCRVWVKDATLALQKNGIIVLSEAVSSIEQRLIRTAERHRPRVEGGQRVAQVNNSSS